MSIDLYYVSFSPPCRAVLMTAKHLNISVNLKNVDLRKGEQLTPNFTKLNPTQKVPVINDNGFILWESRAIMQYLCNEFAPNCSLYPRDPEKRALVDKMLDFSITYSETLREALTLTVVRGIQPTEQQILNYKNTLKLFNTLIGDNKYVAGNELTIADLSLLAATIALSINDFADIEDLCLTNLKLWYNRLEEDLPYFQEVNGELPIMYRKLSEQTQTFYKQCQH